MRKPDNPLDAQLLRSLCTLLTERSVTRAAARLELSQPAMSLTLKRLRRIFADPLLIRGGAGMYPTERARHLLPSAMAALAELDNLLVGPDSFDPASCPQTFKIGIPDYIVPTFVADIVGMFRREAPAARLEVRSLGPELDLESALASGSLDVVVGNWPTPPASLRMSGLFEDKIVCLVGRDHEFVIRRPTLDAFLNANHVAPVSYSSVLRGVVESQLARLHLSRERRIVTSYFTMAPHMLPGSDLVFVTSRHFAEYFAGFLPVCVIDAPIEFPRMQFYQVWHERSHHAPAHVWLRRLIARCRLRLSDHQDP